MNNKQIRAIFLIILIIILFILVFLIFKPFFTIILWATVITIMIKPLYNKIISKFKPLSKNEFLKRVIAAIFSLLIVIIIIVPVIFIFYRLFIEFKQFSIWIDNILKTSDKISFENLNNFIEKIVYKLTAISIKFDIIDEITNFVRIKSLQLTPIIATLLSRIINTVVGVFFLMLTIYFMLTEGEILVKYFKDAIPIDDKYINNFSSKVYQVMNIIIKGYFIIGLYQSIILFLLLIIFKYSNPFLFSTIAFFSSFIPMLGATVVWLPIAFLIGITQNIFRGIIFGLLSGFFVSTVDNFIRPLIISTEIKIHPLLLFFSIIGGIIAFGYNGVILGPLFLALLYSSLDVVKTSNE